MRIYISSTTEDLKQSRSDVARVIEGKGHAPIFMDEYTASDLPPAEKCLRDVAACEVYLGIVAHWYGASPRGESRSFVELEFDHAFERGKIKLIFMRTPMKGVELGEKITRFRKKLESQDQWTVRYWSTENELLDVIRQALDELGAGALVRVERLPPTPPQIFGRGGELEQLERAWYDDRTNVMCLIGFGGTGKSSLINHWINDFLGAPHRGARRILGWSFYAGGSVAGTASADPFIESVYRWLRDEAQGEGASVERIKQPGDPWEKGAQLADLLKERKTLLILDGLEAIQRRAADSSGLDLAMNALLRSLAANNPGLCVITSRFPILELQNFLNKTVREMHLQRLSSRAGVELLRTFDLKGSDHELTEVVEELGGHPLSIRLVGRLIERYCDGVVADRRKLPAGEILKGEVGRLIESYPLGEAELEVLRMLSVFRGPAPLGGLAALRSAPVIPGLTEQLTGSGLSSSARAFSWNEAISNLVGLELVKKRREGIDGQVGPAKAEALDNHALLREYFSLQLQLKNPDSWIEANNRLFEYYRKLAPDQPADFASMAPLFRAVAHGCQAGRYQESWEVEWVRIRRGGEGYSVTHLGAWSEDLAALACFFEEGWDRPVAALSSTARARLLTETAFNLRGLGRLNEAVDPLKGGLEQHIIDEEWRPACDAAGNLAELLTLWGDLQQAYSAAQESIKLAEKAVELSVTPEESREARVTLATNIGTLAEVVHQQGNFEEAEAAFRKADALYTSTTGLPCLHGARGFHFNDLLLDLGKHEEATDRARKGLEVDRARGRPYGVATALLILAQSLMEKFRRGEAADLSPASDKLKEAQEFARQAGFQPYVIRVRTALGALEALSDPSGAISGLDEAMDAAIRGEMRLLAIDAQIEKARALLAMGRVTDSQQCMSAARCGARDTGYLRKAEVLEALQKHCGA